MVPLRLCTMTIREVVPLHQKKKKTMGEMALKEGVRETGSVKLSTKLLKMGIRMVREKREEIKSKA